MMGLPPTQWGRASAVSRTVGKAFRSSDPWSFLARAGSAER